MANDRIIDKIRKVLTLASDKAATQAESENALLRAQEMMAKYNLTQEQISIEEDQGQDIKHFVGQTRKSAHRFAGHLGQVIAQNFKCISYWARSRGEIQLVFVGRKTDCEIACNVYRGAWEALQKLSRKYTRERRQQLLKTQMMGEIDRRESANFRNSFALGFIEGLESKFKEQVAKNNWSLVVIPDEGVKQVYADIDMEKAKESEYETGDNMEAKVKGFEEGQNHNAQKYKTLKKGTSD